MATKKKTDTTTVEEKLRALYDLQIIDSRLDELRNLRGELPIEVEDLENEIAGLEKRVGKIEDEVINFTNEIKIKNELNKNSEAQIKKYKSQQDNVRNNREFEALTKEIEYQELEIQLQDKKIKEINAKIEFKKIQIEEQQAKLSGFQEHLKHKKSELANLIKETEKEENFLLEKSKEFASKIDERLLNSYHRIRKSSKNGLAITSLDRGAVVGSFFTVPPQKQVEIASRKKIILDEHSGKILVDEYLAGEEQEKMQDLLK
jgi:predicted  nucleic acid-binding Zn-ribbon protein